MIAPLTVLYVEDDDDIRAITEFALEDDPGLQLIACASGAEALARADELRPDLLLLDVMMPGMGGVETLRRLREKPHLGATPVIFMTAKVQVAEVQGFLQLDSCGVIAKPFDPNGLAAQIRGFLMTRQRP